MTTIESPVVAKLWQAIEERIGPNRVMFGGSVPNLATELRHSYHRSWQDSPHDGGYSVAHTGDRHGLRGKTQFACALDVSFKAAEDIRKATARLDRWIRTTRNNWQGAVHSPLLREFAGTIDGQQVYALDTTFPRRIVRTYGWDDTHLFHIHLSINRCRILDPRLVSVAEAFGDW